MAVDGTVYQVARMLKTQGVETQVTLNPASLTKRMQNSVKRMLDAKQVARWTSSNAQKIAMMLLKHVGASDIISTSGQTLYIPLHLLENANTEELSNIFRKDYIAGKLTAGHQWSAYDETRFSETLACLRGDTSSFYTCVGLRFHTVEFFEEAKSVSHKLYNEEDIEKFNMAIAIFQRGEPINIDPAKVLHFF